MTFPRSTSRNPTWRRNFTHRPPRPAEGNGRIQKACRRALIAGNGVTTTAEAAQWAFARALLRRRLWKSDYRSVRQALSRIADCIVVRHDQLTNAAPAVWPAARGTWQTVRPRLTKRTNWIVRAADTRPSGRLDGGDKDRRH